MATKRIDGEVTGTPIPRVSGAITENQTSRVTQAAAGGATQRVTAAAAGGLTSRISHLLLLEGDEAGGYLLLEGDMQSADDVLKLEGDATSIGSTVTRRVNA